MAYQPHTLVQLSGTLGPVADPTEIWSFGLRVGSYESGGGSVTDMPTLLETQLYLAEIVPLLTTAIANNSSLRTAGSVCRVDTIKANAIGPDGKYFYDETVSAEVQFPLGSSIAAVQHPFQSSKVVTLETGRTRGKAARGRIYVPAPINVMSNGGTWDVLQAEVDAWADVIGSLNVQSVPTGRTWYVGVFSSTGDLFTNARPVEAVSMDSVPDTQRRRANDLVGVRLTSDI